MSAGNEGWLRQWFSSLKAELESAYLRNEQPWEQSGFYISESAWVACRKPVADCVDKSGSFLDIGCANGYLLESIMKWTGERGLNIIPYGIDLSEKLITLAKKRLPEYSNNFYTGNGLYWYSRLKFDYVRTELVYVPDELQEQYVNRIIDSYVVDEGRLLLNEYRSRGTPFDAAWFDIKINDWGLNVHKQFSGYFDNKELMRVSIIIKHRG